MKKLVLDGESLDLPSVWAWAHRSGGKLALSPTAMKRVRESHAFVGRIVGGENAVYGVNTGFGLLSDVKIPRDKLAQLQLNLLRSHAVGVGHHPGGRAQRVCGLHDGRLREIDADGVHGDRRAQSREKGSAAAPQLHDGGALWQAELLHLVREQFDVVLIDTPPMVNIADARVIGQHADAVVLVVRSGVTSRDAALLARSRFADDGIPLLGTILNGWKIGRAHV